MDVAFEPSDLAWREFPQAVENLCARPDVRRVCDVGGGARPLLSPLQTASLGIEYTVLDNSRSELDKTPYEFDTVVADIGMPLTEVPRYDLVFSRMLAEHVADPAIFHRNVRRMLRTGGIALHFFPTLYAPAFVVNRLVPARLTQRLLLSVQPRRYAGGTEGKFPAYYRWCRGFTTAQVRRLNSCGFAVLGYRSYFGTPGYFSKIHLDGADRGLARWLASRRVVAISSYAIVTLEAD